MVGGLSMFTFNSETLSAMPSKAIFLALFPYPLPGCQILVHFLPGLVELRLQLLDLLLHVDSLGDREFLQLLNFLIQFDNGTFEIEGESIHPVRPPISRDTHPT